MGSAVLSKTEAKPSLPLSSYTTGSCIHSHSLHWYAAAYSVDMVLEAAFSITNSKWGGGIIDAKNNTIEV
jgi:hypothetical protein